MSQIGKNIELYLMDGEASGRWQATLSNWNCCSYKIPRGSMKSCDDLPEIYSPGVYFLFGRDDESGKQFVYVGEGDNAAKRIMQPHSFEKDGSYWTEAVIFVTPDGTLDKARIKYLENRFHAIVVETERYIVKNGNTPPQSPVQKKVRDMLEEFIMNARLVMLALGHKVFEPLPSANTEDSADELLYFSRNQGKGGNAVGKIADDGFWVLKGSYINPEIASYVPTGVLKFRKLYATDIDKNGILQKDLCFGSPSYASAFVCGKSSNGLTEWKNADGKTLKDMNDEIDDTARKAKVKKKVKASVIVTPGVEDKQIKVEYTDDDVLHLAGKHIAYAYALKDCFLVKKGSSFSDKESNSCGLVIRNYRQKLIDEGNVSDGFFVKDVKFKSPSTAAACILGRSVNGRTVWLNKDGKTLKELQESEMACRV